MEQVEGEERDRPTRLAAQSSRQFVPIGSTGAIDDDQFPVEDRRARGDTDGESGQFGECGRDVHTGRVPDPHFAVPDHVGRSDRDERPLAAPPWLEQVLVRIERFRQRTRQHRPQVREIGQLIGLEPQRKLVGHRSMVAR